MGLVLAAVLFLPALMFGWRAIAAIGERKFEIVIGSRMHSLRLERRPLKLGCLLLVHLIAVYFLAALALTALWRSASDWPALICSISSAWSGFALWRVASITRPERGELLPRFVGLLTTGRHAQAAQLVAASPDASMPRLASAALGVPIPRSAPRAYRSSGVGDVSLSAAHGAIEPALRRERRRISLWAASGALGAGTTIAAALGLGTAWGLLPGIGALIAAAIALEVGLRGRRELAKAADELSAALAEQARQRPRAL